ncbi:MAG: acetolactate synthase [Candidatus Verstraetearchaeota archaeon]|nr:acetolactate synthase [Candidatus Verstraetearchaeota archaeon]
MVKQFSIFLENKPGRLSSVIDLFERNQIRVLAMGIAEAGNYGIVRCILDAPEKAAEVLRDANTAVNLVEVVIIDMKDLHNAVKVLGEKGINVDYAYTMDMGRIVIKVDDEPKAKKVLSESGIRTY